MRKNIILLSVIPAFGFMVGIYLIKFYDCGASIFCYDLDTKAYALLYGMGALLIIFFALFFLPQAFNSWKKFAIWFVPVVAIIFATQDDKGSGFMDIAPSSVQVFIWLSILYVLISLIIIVYSQHKLKKKK